MFNSAIKSKSLMGNTSNRRLGIITVMFSLQDFRHIHGTDCIYQTKLHFDCTCNGKHIDWNILGISNSPKEQTKKDGQTKIIRNHIVFSNDFYNLTANV